MDQNTADDPNRQLRRQGTSLTPKNVTARIAYQTYFCLLGTTLLILSILSYYMYSDALDHYQYILENWKQQPIQSIRVSFDTCNQNEVDLINYQWPGTMDGCDCRYGFRVLTEAHKRHEWFPRSKIYNNHACNITQLAFGCVSVYELEKMTFDKFPTPSHEGFKLCAVLEKNNSFYSHLPEQDECPQGQKKCGNQIDHFYCTSEQECPVYEIGFKGISEIQNPIEQTEHGVTFVYNRKNENKLPLVEVRVSEGEGVCMKNHIRGITSGRVEYPLMNENKTECDQDLRFTKLLTTNEVKYYKANDKMWLKSRLRGYEISDEYQWGLYSRGYIEWKMECRGVIFDDFIDQQSILEDILIAQRNLMIVSIIFFIIISCGLSYVQCSTLSGEDWECIKGKGTEESNTIFYFEIVVKVILQTIQAIVIIVTFEAVKKEIDFLSNIVTRNCSDGYVQFQLGYLIDVLTQDIYQFNVVQLVLFIITTVLDLAIAFILAIQFYRLKRQKYSPWQQQQIEMPSVPIQNNVQGLGYAPNNPYVQQYNT